MMTFGVCFATVYGTMEHNHPFECPSDGPDTKFRPVPSNDPNYRSWLGDPNIRPMATKIAMKLAHHYLNIIRQEKIS